MNYTYYYELFIFLGDFSYLNSQKSSYGLYFLKHPSKKIQKLLKILKK